MDLFAFFQDSPPIISQPQGTDWVQLATTIGGFLVTIVGMVLTYLKANKAVATANLNHENMKALIEANHALTMNRLPIKQVTNLNPSSIPSNP